MNDNTEHECPYCKRRYKPLDFHHCIQMAEQEYYGKLCNLHFAGIQGNLAFDLASKLTFEQCTNLPYNK